MARRQAYIGSRADGQPGSRGLSPRRGDKKRTLEEYDDEDGESPMQVGNRPSAPFADGGNDMEMS